MFKIIESKGQTFKVFKNGDIHSMDCTYKTTRIKKGITQVFDVNRKGKKLSQCIAKNGYLEVAMCINGNRLKHSVHRLVGIAFVDGYKPDLTINHIDGNKLNNDPSNLEWVSLARNTQHQWETGLVNLRGENQPMSKLTSKRVVYIRKLINQGINCNTIAIVADISPTIIYRIKEGKQWKHVPIE